MFLGGEIMINQAMGSMTRRMLLGTSMVALAAIGFQAAPTDAEELVLKYNRWLPTTHPQDVEGLLPFFDEVAEVTEGRVRIEPTTAALAPPPRQMEAVKAGVVDIAYGGQSLTPGLFPLADIVALPFVGDSAEAVAVAFWRTHNEFFAEKEDYPGVQLLALAAVSPYNIYSSGKIVESVDDLSGMKLRSTGAIAPQIAEALGAVPVPIDITGMYDALSKKILDGAMNNDDQMRAFGVTEFVKQRIAIPGGLLGAPLYLIMNEGKWDQISPEDQAAIMELAGETLGARLSRLADISGTQGIQMMEAQGTTLSTADDAMMAELKARLKPIEDAWIAQADNLGVDGAAALQMMRDTAAEVVADKQPIDDD